MAMGSSNITGRAAGTQSRIHAGGVASMRPHVLTRHGGRCMLAPVAAVVSPQAAVPSPAPAKQQGPIIINGQVLHSLTQERLDVVKDMKGYMTQHVMPLLKPVEQCWQPYDLLPRSEDPDFLDQVQELRKRTANLPDEYLVVFVGDMITEEALPTYMAMINTLDGVRDETGAQDTPWAHWTREWTAEENRHGDAMSKYMYLSGRVDMKAVERTVQHLISSGMDPKTENNPYLGFVYTSFQEKATRISHGNTARWALECGDKTLAKMCGLIASDEARHEHAYQRIIDGVMDRDPDGAMLAYADMMRKQITMPAHLMRDGVHDTNNPGHNLFADFSAVAERTGTYTAMDYADIMDYLNARWKVADRHFVNGEAAEGQEFVLKLPARIRKLAERAQARKKKDQAAQFSWLFNRKVTLH